MSVFWTVDRRVWAPDQLNPPADLTLFRLSVELLGQGLWKNTLGELLRLNTGLRADEVLSAYVSNPTGPQANRPVELWQWVQITVPDDAGSGSYAPEPYLRMAQRNDGLGPFRHPRLRSSASSASSVQAGQAPRVGRNNRYR